MEEAYYKKILVSSGEVPEKEGDYDTSLGLIAWSKNHWYGYQPITWWMKPVPSPKQEAIEFAEWVCENTLDDLVVATATEEGNRFYLEGETYVEMSLTELYDKFKEIQND